MSKYAHKSHRPCTETSRTHISTPARSQVASRRRKWDDERLERELRSIIVTLGKWPTRKELLEEGRADVVGATDRRGGLNAWALKLGYTPRRKLGEVYWTEERVRLTLREFLKDRRVTFPTQREFAEARLSGLWWVLQERKELGRWAREFRLEEPRPGRPRKWTDETIRTTLAEFLEGRSTWPTTREFQEVELGGLRNTLRRRGEIQRWADEFSVVLPTHPEQRKVNVIQATYELIEEHYSDPAFSLDVVAQEIGISIRQVQRILKEAGNDFRRQLIDLRMKKAAELFRVNPRLKVQEIAEKVGYKQGMHFAKAFRRAYGKSPREWRRQMSEVCSAA